MKLSFIFIVSLVISPPSNITWVSVSDCLITVKEAQQLTMSVDTVPKSMKQLRACLVCSLVKTFDQFESDGCDNCESVLHLKRNRDNVYDCTSSNFEVRQELNP